MHSPFEYKNNIERNVLGKYSLSSKGNDHWSFGQEKNFKIWKKKIDRRSMILDKIYLLK
ncbi:hypothetical protein MBGDC06_00721 [Thermoplasmatales archaeon SCGC AB-539-C06]|nr:hypothetical protein MBGDC06_00721 [Thermoplasmatales archaeon SCGC AB-539-C06]